MNKRPWVSAVSGVALALSTVAPTLASDLLSEPPPDPTAFAAPPPAQNSVPANTGWSEPAASASWNQAPPTNTSWTQAPPAKAGWNQTPPANSAPPLAPQRPTNAASSNSSGPPPMDDTASTPRSSAAGGTLALPGRPANSSPAAAKTGSNSPTASPTANSATSPAGTTKSGQLAPPQAPKLAPEVPKTATPPFPTTPMLPPSQMQSQTQSPAQAQSKPATPPDQNYPAVSKLEEMTFGTATPDKPIQDRLNSLETAVYKTSYPNDTLFDRTERLKKTLLGADYDQNADDEDMRVPAYNRIGRSPLDSPEPTTNGDNAASTYYEQLAQQPENQAEISKEDQLKYALELINQERNRLGMQNLSIDEQAQEVAKKQVEDLCKRNTVSHANKKGENPDRRYTIEGGTGALSESLVSLGPAEAGAKKHSKEQVLRMLKMMMSRQDDREAVLSADATDVGLASEWSEDKQRYICCTEILCKRGIIHPIPDEVRIGEKIEVKGVITQPYQFARITLAWEGDHTMSSAADESKEALPYFPPLDYVAYQNKSEHDYSGAMTALRTVGVIAAIAGGMFMPPVALAAPLIAMSGSTGEPKPVSDIPVHGGVKVEGSVFSGHIPISNENKAGIYYVTVWASMGKYSKPFPISRRAIIAKDFEEDVSAKPLAEDNNVDKNDDTDKHKEKKKKKKDKDKDKGD